MVYRVAAQLKKTDAERRASKCPNCTAGPGRVLISPSVQCSQTVILYLSQKHAVQYLCSMHLSALLNNAFCSAACIMQHAFVCYTK